MASRPVDVAPETFVYVDASVLIGHGVSDSFHVLVRETRTARFAVSVLVLEEFAKNYAEARSKAQKQVRPFLQEDRLPEVKDVRRELEQRLSAAGVEILEEFPDVQARELALRDLNKPFGKGRIGIRDYLHWRTFLGRVAALGTEGVFLTADGGFREKDTVRPHEDLRADLLECGLDAARMKVLNMQEFREQFGGAMPSGISKEVLDRALEAWLSMAEDAEILQAMGLPGPGYGIELRVRAVRDKGVSLLQGPGKVAEGPWSVVVLAIHATLDCEVLLERSLVESLPALRDEILPSQFQPWVGFWRTVRMEWEIEADYREDRGEIVVGRQLHAPRSSVVPYLTA